VHHATSSEQKIQHITCYLLLLLGIALFNFATDFKPSWISLGQINVVFALMALVIMASL